jgi:hypothetical protein
VKSDMCFLSKKQAIHVIFPEFRLVMCSFIKTSTKSGILFQKQTVFIIKTSSKSGILFQKKAFFTNFYEKELSFLELPIILGIMCKK